ncbi:MAG: outer membrane beta-barrel protein [Myxococcales bacterium]|nr:outer membrane beta-barrel protein [Myxococcales bacterium]
MRALGLATTIITMGLPRIAGAGPEPTESATNEADAVEEETEPPQAAASDDDDALATEPDPGGPSPKPKEVAPDGDDTDEPSPSAAPEGTEVGERAQADAGTEPSASDEAEPRTDAEAVDAEAQRRLPAWLQRITVGAFVDVYASLNVGLPRPEVGGNAFRAFDQSNGFSLAWAGLDIDFDAPKAAATVDLRFGPSTNAGWSEDSIMGIQLIKQAFGTWKIHDKVELDFGRFNTIFGAEVSESWMNHTYTRGMLYDLAQPFWHTGLRGRAQLNDTFGLNALLVNGWGHVIDNNAGKDYGLQLAVTPGEVFGLYAGYLTGPEGNEVYLAPDPGDPTRMVELETPGVNRRFRHLVDVVVTVAYRKLSLALNADYVRDDEPMEIGGLSQWYGGMLSGSYRFVHWFGLAARAELLGDPDGWMTGASEGALLGTGTLTLDFRPRPYLVLRLEGRVDGSNESLFPRGYGSTSSHQLTTTLGLVVTSF